MDERPTGEEYRRMVSGQMYAPGDPELARWSLRARHLVWQWHQVPPTDGPGRRALLEQIFGSLGQACTIEAGLHLDYGFNISLGERFYANTGCSMLDAAPITIGADVMFAPHVQLSTATHPIDPVERNSGREYALPIVIGDRVWLAGGVIVGPGVTIGSDTVVGAGAVVLRDLPAGVVAAGTPARVLREV
jgi:maltose O-acetyltransferase